MDKDGTNKDLMLKNPSKIDVENEKAGSDVKERGAKRPPRMSFHEMQEYCKSLSYQGKRRKKVTVRLDKEYLEYEKKNPPPQPFKPVHMPDYLLRNFFDTTIAEQKAAWDEHERIIKEYEDHGYAEIQVEVTDDEEEDDL